MFKSKVSVSFISLINNDNYERLIELIKEIREIKFPQERLIENSLKLSISLIHLTYGKINRFNSEFLKKNSITAEDYNKLKKESLELKKEIDLANSKIVNPKSYDKENLADYFFEVAKRKKGRPSSRDLAKGSEWNKDKWGIVLKNDYVLIGNIFMRLQIEIKNNPKTENQVWLKDLLSEYQNKFADIQIKESNSNKSFAKKFDDNISY